MTEYETAQNWVGMEEWPEDFLFMHNDCLCLNTMNGMKRYK